MATQETKYPVDEFVHLTDNEQDMLFSGWIRRNSTKSQCEMLLTSAIFIINKYAEFLPEIWDQKLKSEYIDIQGLSVVINTEKSMNAEQSIYCIKRVSSGKHKWKFRYDQVTEYEWNLIGVGKTRTSLPTGNPWMGHGGDYGYAFAGPQSVTAEPKWMLYGTCCQSGDIVEMILDLDERTVSYAINDKDYGIADHDIEQTEYRAGVTLYKNDDKITLLSYERL